MTWPPSILSVLVWTPALGAVVSALLGEGRLRRRIAIGFAGVSLVLAAAIAIPFDSGTPPRELLRWVPSLGLVLRSPFLDGFGSLLVLWIALLTFLASVSLGCPRAAEPRVWFSSWKRRFSVSRWPATPSLFLSFYGAGLLVVALLLGRAEAMKTFLVVPDRGGRARRRFDRSLVPPGPRADGIPVGGDRAVLLARDLSRFSRRGCSSWAPPRSLSPLRSSRSTSWVRAREIGTEGRLAPIRRVEPRGHSTSSRGRLSRPIPAASGSAVRRWRSRRFLSSMPVSPRASSRAPLLVGFQGLVVLGLLSPDTGRSRRGSSGNVAARRSLSSRSRSGPRTPRVRGPSLTSAIAIAMFLPASWLVLRQHWNDAPRCYRALRARSRS